MVSYKELGLVNTREMFAKAIKGGYAIPAFNFNNMEQLQAIIGAVVETKSPVILQVSSGARKYANQTLLRYMAQGAVEYAKELGCPNPQIALHLDHGDRLELCKSCIEMGFSSVMIDGSLSRSVPRTGLTSSRPSSASAMLTASSYLPPSASTSSLRSRSRSLASPSCSTAPAPCPRTRSLRSTSTAVH